MGLSEYIQYLRKGRKEIITYDGRRKFLIKRSFSGWKLYKAQEERYAELEKRAREQEQAKSKPVPEISTSNLETRVNKASQRVQSLIDRKKPRPSLNTLSGYAFVKIKKNSIKVSVEYLKNPLDYMIIESKRMIKKEETVMLLYKDRNISEKGNSVYMNVQQIAATVGMSKHKVYDIINKGLETGEIKKTRTQMAEEKREELIKEIGWERNVKDTSVKQLADSHNLSETTVRKYVDTYNQGKEQERTQNLLEKKKAIREKRFNRYRNGLMYNPTLA